jgi:hypothetical protein
MKLTKIFKNKIVIPKKQNGGQAMLVSVLYFLFISLSVVSGIVSPSVREYKTVSVDLNSKKSYFLAESGIEDAIYRTKQSLPISGSETLSIGGNTATTVITTNINGAKSIESVGDITNYSNRKLTASLSTDVGVSFNYGVQVGQGGLHMTGSGRVNGNVYANGPITGDSSAVISGSAISANSPSLVADQTHGSGTPAYDVIFANNNSTQDIAQSFSVTSNTLPLNKVEFYIKKVSTPSDATVTIRNDSSGSPGSTVLATGTLYANSVTTSYGWINVSFNTNPLLVAGATYWLVIDASTHSSRYYTIGANNGGYANGLGKIGRLGNSWSNTTPSGLDYFFKIYLGGVNGLIAGSSGNQSNPLHIGTVSGTAQANTVNYTHATGNIYCQNGTGNNKSCTPQSDPVYIAFPVSEANIQSWKTEAEAGGIINGDYVVGPWPNQNMTLGSKKIIGNLIVSNGGVLTLSGNLWVTGTITLNGNGRIRLASSYGTDDGVIVADGDVAISGGGNATGSGTVGSYLMILTTSSSNTAMSINGGAGAVIAYAPNGTVAISGGASLKEATGYRMTVGGGSSITYESGLTNNNFSSGPGGTWNISSWKESE